MQFAYLSDDEKMAEMANDQVKKKTFPPFKNHDVSTGDGPLKANGQSASICDVPEATLRGRQYKRQIEAEPYFIIKPTCELSAHHPKSSGPLSTYAHYKE